MRMYEREWELLKAKGHNGTIRISAPSHMHKRVYKAVRKEKNLDTVYKYQLSEEGKLAMMSAESVGLILTLRLTIKDFPKFYNVTNLF